jgi:nicotinamidase/pyrazinamidase
MKKALILVDIQNDFCPGGALAVNEGDQVVKVANNLMDADVFDLVVATQDWHPACHGSFASNNEGSIPFTMGKLFGIDQVWWPDHCVWGTKGAEFHPDLNQDRIAAIFRKGMNSGLDSYSGFLENDKETQTGLAQFLEHNDYRLYIMGLATDYCVKYTVLDAIKFGFDVTLIVDGCRGVNMNDSDSQIAIDDMEDAGARIIKSAGLI